MNKRNIFPVITVVLFGGILSACTATVSIPISMPEQADSSSAATGTAETAEQAELEIPAVANNFTVKINSIVPYEKVPQPGVDLDDPIYGDHLYTVNYTVTYIGMTPMTYWQVPRIGTEPPISGVFASFTQDDHPIATGDTFEFSTFVDEDLAIGERDYFLVGPDAALKEFVLLETITLGPDDLT